MGIFLGIILTLIGFFFLYKNKKEDTQIKIIRETKTEFKYIRHPLNYNEYIDCYKSQLNILGDIRNNILHISVFDFCKEAQKDFILSSIIKDRYKKTILFNYGFIYINKKTYSLYGLSFLYRWKFVSFGLSGNVNFENNIYEIIGSAGLSF